MRADSTTKSLLPASPLRTIFLKHPESIGESYWAHLRAALGISGSLLFTAATAFIHALIPCVCETTARKRIAAVNARLQSRSDISRMDQHQVPH
jgi:hypothetical protein